MIKFIYHQRKEVIVSTTNKSQVISLRISDVTVTLLPAIFMSLGLTCWFSTLIQKPHFLLFKTR